MHLCQRVVADTTSQFRYMTSAIVSFFSFREVLAVAGVMTVALLSRILFFSAVPFQSDESVYTYAGYVIANGGVPYRDIFLAHPPIMYLVYALFIRLWGPNLFLIRLSNVGIYLVNVFLTYVLGRLLLNGRKSNIASLLAVVFFAFFPSFFILLSESYLLENLLTLFALSSFILYFVFRRRSLGNSVLFLISIICGIAIVTTFRAIVFVAALFLFHLFALLWNKKIRQALTDSVVILAGVAVPIAITLLTVTFYWDVFPQFSSQLLTNLSIVPQSLAGRFDSLSWYVNSMFPLIALAVLGTVYSVKRFMSKGNRTSLLLSYYYWLPISVIALVLNPVRFHYFSFLNPFLAVLSVVGILEIAKFVSEKTETKNTLLMSFLIILVGFASFQGAAYAYNKTVPYFQVDPYVGVNRYLGEYVANITQPSDRIWTSEGAIGFFAERTVVAPNSSQWPFIVFFSDILGVREDTGTFENGLLKPQDFVNSFEANRVKVVVIIQGKGWVPYPDDYLLSGYESQEGLETYLEAKYHCVSRVYAEEIPYTYYVWERNQE
jgi:hypothetical protein